MHKCCVPRQMIWIVCMAGVHTDCTKWGSSWETSHAVPSLRWAPLSVNGYCQHLWELFHAKQMSPSSNRRKYWGLVSHAATTSDHTEIPHYQRKIRCVISADSYGEQVCSICLLPRKNTYQALTCKEEIRSAAKRWRKQQEHCKDSVLCITFRYGTLGHIFQGSRMDKTHFTLWLFPHSPMRQLTTMTILSIGCLLKMANCYVLLITPITFTLRQNAN